MKHAKRLASVLLAMVMVLAMGVTAFATEPEGAGGDNSSDGGKKEVTHTYEIYQIFTGDYSEGGVLSNIKWGKNGTGKEGEKVAQDILDELEAVKDKTSDTEKLKVINKYANLSSTPIETGSGTEYTDLKPGYYLVKDKDGSLNGTGDAYTLYVVQVVDGTLTFKPKSDVPKVDKKIVEDGKEVENNSASIGDVVKYEITGTLPDRYDDYETYFYKFTDTLSKGLTYQGDLKITVNGNDVTQAVVGDPKNVGKIDDAMGVTTIEVTIPDLKTYLSKKGNNDKIVITYSAKLNENAVIADNGNTNNVKLEYSNDPNHSGTDSTNPTGETPEDQVTTLTTELEITKTDENGNFLPGVEFTLEGNGVNIVLVTAGEFTKDASGEYWKLKDGTYTKTAPNGNEDKYDSINDKYVLTTTNFVAKGSGTTQTDVVGIVDGNGKVRFSGLGAGEYTLRETKTPAGYNTIDNIKFTIGFDADNKVFTVEPEDGPIQVGATNILTANIVNKSGSLLPSTGGIGTTIFYIVGGVLVVGAAILLIAKKRAK